MPTDAPPSLKRPAAAPVAPEPEVAPPPLPPVVPVVADRASIVAWLRNRTPAEPHDQRLLKDKLADAIERNVDLEVSA